MKGNTMNITEKTVATKKPWAKRNAERRKKQIAYKARRKEAESRKRDWESEGFFNLDTMWKEEKRRANKKIRAAGQLFQHGAYRKVGAHDFGAIS